MSSPLPKADRHGPLASLVPFPNWIRETGGRFLLGRADAVCVPDLFHDSTYATARFLADELALRHGLRLDLRRAPATHRPPRLLVGTLDQPSVRSALGGLLGRPAARKVGAEGYLLAVRPAGAVVAGHDARGLFYGVHTLLQLLSGAGGRASLPCVEVIDWPEHPFRGAHLYMPPKRELDYSKRLLAFLASCKINTVFFEVGASMEFKRHPEINRAWARLCETITDHPNGPTLVQHARPLHGRGSDSTHHEQAGSSFLSQDDVRDLLAHARAHHVRLCPEFQSLSHSFWLCVAHPEIAEYAGDPWPSTYCPSNPRTYELLFDCLDEVLDVFRPEWVHIGHDEWYYPCVCPKCRRKDAGKVLAGDVNRIHARLRERGVKCLMWGDQLLDTRGLQTPRIREYGTGKMIHFGGCRRAMRDEAGAYVMPQRCHAVDLISDEVLVADWYWGLTHDTEKYYARHGKDVVFGNFSPAGFNRFRHRLYAPNVQGGIRSSWIQQGQLAHAANNWPLSAAMSADMFWSGIYRRVSLERRLPAFRAFWLKARDRLNGHTRRLATRQPAPWRARPLDLDRLPRPAVSPAPAAPRLRLERRDHPVPFQLARAPIVVPPAGSPLVLPVRARVRAIVFLHTYAPGKVPPSSAPLYEFASTPEFLVRQELGRYTVRTRSVPRSVYHPVRPWPLSVRLGVEVGLSDKPDHAPTFCDALPAGKRMLYAWEWTNPNPDFVEVEEIALERGRSPFDGELQIHGITLVLAPQGT
jgi:hypothetical protein